jgi:hypothetical protein
MIVVSNAPLSIVVWSLVLVAVVIAGYATVLWVRRKLRPADEPPVPGFTLEDLRQMHRKGQLTDEEFERARSRMAASLRPQVEKQRP